MVSELCQTSASVKCQANVTATFCYVVFLSEGLPEQRFQGANSGAVDALADESHSRPQAQLL